MEDDKLQDLFETRAQADEELEKLRSPMTILFSDIKGSTMYAEKKGDVEFMAMINRHNRILFPVIEAEGGHVVKTIGDSILAKFDDPVAAVKAAAEMQRALARDREGREEIEQIRVRIGLHYGMGLLKDNDVFGDVVNAASRVEHQAQAEQILITDVLLESARAAGFECAKMGRAQLRGKDEPIDLYAVAWSESATQQLIEEVQARYERQLKELKTEQAQLEREFEKAREQWRIERRTLNAEIEEVEESAESAMELAREQVSKDLYSELRFQIEELTRTRQQLEEDLVLARERSEAEKNNLRAQIAALEARFVENMERSNNPARTSMAVREQVEARLAEARQEWQLQSEGERKRLVAEVERLKKVASPLISDEKKEAARRALLVKLGKLPPGSEGPALKTVDQWEREFEDARIQWDTEREQLLLKLRKLEGELKRSQESVLREEDFQQLQAQYESKIDEGTRHRQALELEIQSITSELASERQRLNARIKALEQAIPEAQEAARKQALAELQSEFEVKAEEASRLRTRIERQHQEQVEEWEEQRRRASKQIAELEGQLKEAKEAAYRALRGPAPI